MFRQAFWAIRSQAKGFKNRSEHLQDTFKIWSLGPHTDVVWTTNTSNISFSVIPFMEVCRQTTYDMWLKSYGWLGLPGLVIRRSTTVIKSLEDKRIFFKKTFIKMLLLSTSSITIETKFLKQRFCVGTPDQILGSYRHPCWNFLFGT